MRRISFRLGRRRGRSLHLPRQRMQRLMFHRTIEIFRKKRRKADRKVQRNRLSIPRKVVSPDLKRANQRRNQTTMASASLTSPAKPYLVSTNHKAAQLNLHPSNPHQSTQPHSTRVTLCLLRNLQPHKAFLLRDRPPLPHNLLRQPLSPFQPLQALTLSSLRAGFPPLQPISSLEMILPISFIQGL